MAKERPQRNHRGATASPASCLTYLDLTDRCA